MNLNCSGPIESIKKFTSMSPILLKIGSDILQTFQNSDPSLFLEYLIRFPSNWGFSRVMSKIIKFRSKSIIFDNFWPNWAIKLKISLKWEVIRTITLGYTFSKKIRNCFENSNSKIKNRQFSTWRHFRRHPS